MGVHLPLCISAPGKVILFGEHAVVFRKKAIAASVSLRAYLVVDENKENPDQIKIVLPDIDLEQSWKISDLPWHKVSIQAHEAGHELDHELVEALEIMLLGIDSTIRRSAALSFLYLLMTLQSKSMPGLVFGFRSTLPIGSGLGSSASISVCLSTAFNILNGSLQTSHTVERDSSTETTTEQLVDNPALKLINDWAFLGEKCIQGNPSGIDNAVATYGGAVLFQRNEPGELPLQIPMRNFPPLRFILTDSRQSRHSLHLVAGVGEIRTRYPKIIEPILESINEISEESFKLLSAPVEESSQPAWTNKLRELIRVNHGLLASLGVSHPKLEIIKALADEFEIGETKLTGAGGGGCAITLLNDNISELQMAEFRKQIEQHGFHIHDTMLGCPGVGFIDLSLGRKGDNTQFNGNLTNELCSLTTRNEIETWFDNFDDKWHFW